MSGSANWVDTHVHIFERGLPLASGRRYQPDYDATPEALRQEISEAGISKAILVQPSFLGTDNSYLLTAMADDPTSFACVAVIEPDMEFNALSALKERGVVGIRLNCIGQSTPDLKQGIHRDMAERLGELGLVLQIQAEREQWLSIAPALGNLPCKVLIDHFGRTPKGDPSVGFEALLSAAETAENVWFKFSGPYRLAERKADLCAASILETIGTSRIVWGSDWPWTQFEKRYGYGETLHWLDGWVPDIAARQRILTENAARLFDFKLHQ